MRKRRRELVRRFNAPKACHGDVIDPDFDDNSDFISGLSVELDHTGAVGCHALSEMIINVSTPHHAR